MPNLSRIHLTKIIPSQSHIIFTTTYSEYAVESYNLNATDYLLKPITFQRFLKAVTKVYDIVKKDTELKRTNSKQTILIKSGYQNHLLELDTILYLEKDGNYMIYHTLEKKILARETIAETLAKLPSSSKFINCILFQS